MPLDNLGSLFISHAVFLIHIVYCTIAFMHVEPSALFVLYCVVKVLGQRGEDFDQDTSWPPRSPRWLFNP
ncbi:unnamed protein product [Clonostachys byssicola]|uniref:Uncharacterized protein n=1 Tax=Clonostachys byssicola TaxID=160290 RepID=A0A9N9XWQ6_9HYPO|nr:unnamed protein product [Clonostachys byssicola]